MGTLDLPTHPRGFADLAAAVAFRAFDYPDPNPHAAYRVWHCTCRQCGHLCATLREQADGSPPVVSTIRRVIGTHLVTHARLRAAAAAAAQENQPVTTETPLTLRTYANALSVTRGATTLRYDAGDYQSLHYAADVDRVLQEHGDDTYDDEAEADAALCGALASTVFVSTYARGGSAADRAKLLATAAAEGVIEREPGTIYA